MTSVKLINHSSSTADWNNEVTGIPPKPIPPDRAGNIRSDLADNIVHQGFFGLPDGTRRYLRNSRRTTTGKWSDGVRAS